LALAESMTCLVILYYGVMIVSVQGRLQPQYKVRHLNVE